MTSGEQAMVMDMTENTASTSATLFPAEPVVPPVRKYQRKSFKKVKVAAPAQPSDTTDPVNSSSPPQLLSPSKSQPSSSLPFNSKKPKEKSLTYVNYLNAFANSLAVHPPAKRSSKSGAGAPKSPMEDEASNSSIPSQQIDFETGGKIGSVIPYLPDVDRDRCCHLDSFCPFSKREGYMYCEKHLLDDKSLPFVPCAYQRTEANPCPYPARMPPGAGGKNRPQRSKEALCAMHLEKCMEEVRANMGSKANSILTIMDDLGTYNINSDKGLPPTNATDMFEELGDPQSREGLETYLRATAKDTYASDSSEDKSTVDEKDFNLFTSKALDTDDEFDSDSDDPTRRAGTYTVEELLRQLRAKMAKQKELLAFEVQLQEYKLKDARAIYLEEVAAEKTFMPTVHHQARTDPSTLRSYRQLRTMLRFHRRRPRFSFTHAKKPPTRIRNNVRPPDASMRCVHQDPEIPGKPGRCRQYSLPFSKHCYEHILEDTFQYLYKKCAAEFPVSCRSPVLRNMGNKYCCMHADLNEAPTIPNLDETQTISDSSDEECNHEDVPVEPVVAVDPAPSPTEDESPEAVAVAEPVPVVAAEPVVEQPRQKRKYVRRKPLAPKVKAPKSSKKKSKTKVESNDSGDAGTPDTVVAEEIA